MCDELWVQVLKQLESNPSATSVARGWRLLSSLLTVQVTPSPHLAPYVEAFMRAHHCGDLVRALLAATLEVRVRDEAKRCLDLRNTGKERDGGGGGGDEEEEEEEGKVSREEEEGGVEPSEDKDIDADNEGRGGDSSEDGSGGGDNDNAPSLSSILWSVVAKNCGLKRFFPQGFHFMPFTSFNW